MQLVKTSFIVEFTFLLASVSINFSYFLAFPVAVRASHPVFGVVTLLDNHTIFLELWTEDYAKLDELWNLTDLTSNEKSQNVKDLNPVLEFYGNGSLQKIHLAVHELTNKTRPLSLTSLLSASGQDLNTNETSAENEGQSFTSDSNVTKQIDLNKCKETLVHALQEWYEDYENGHETVVRTAVEKKFESSFDDQQNVKLLDEIGETLQHALKLLQRRPGSKSKVIIDDTQPIIEDSSRFFNDSKKTLETFYESKGDSTKVHDKHEDTHISVRASSLNDSFQTRKSLSGPLFVTDDARTLEPSLNGRTAEGSDVALRNISNFEQTWLCSNYCKNWNESSLPTNVISPGNIRSVHVRNNLPGKPVARSNNHDTSSKSSTKVLPQEQGQLGTTTYSPIDVFVAKMQGAALKFDDASSTSLKKLDRKTLIGRELSGAETQKENDERRKVSAKSEVYKQEFDGSSKSTAKQRSFMNNSETTHELLARKQESLGKTHDRQDFMIATRFGHNAIFGYSNKTVKSSKSYQKTQNGKTIIDKMHKHFGNTLRANVAASNEKTKHKKAELKAYAHSAKIAEKLGTKWVHSKKWTSLSSSKNGVLNASNVSVLDTGSKLGDTWLGKNGSEKSSSWLGKYGYNNFTTKTQHARNASSSNDKNSQTAFSFIKNAANEKTTKEFNEKNGEHKTVDVGIAEKSETSSAMDDIINTVNEIFPTYQNNSIDNKRKTLSNSCGHL